MPQKIFVQKYGGSSVADPMQIRSIANAIKQSLDRDISLIVVVSAMGKTTDQLLELAYQVSQEPKRRELDMLLSAGERITMALMSMALNENSVAAISFTGSQAGILTDDQYSNARILDLKPVRVESEIAEGKVVVIAGFQGVSPSSKEITTLGRGGTDVTAVAMAAHFKAQRCEIRKDVDGVYSCDPKVIPSARHIANLNYQQLLDMTFWGARVLHYRSVELAASEKVPLWVGLSHEEAIERPKYTLIDEGDPSMFEQPRILSVNTHDEVRWIDIKMASLNEAFRLLQQILKRHTLPIPQFLDSERQEKGWKVLITAPTEVLRSIEKVCAEENSVVFCAEEIATVTITCQGSYASDVPGQITNALERVGILIEKILFGSMSLSLIVQKKDQEKAMQILHALNLN